jgi:hypothetical protein
MSEQRQQAQIGDVRWSYTIQPVGLDGKWINGGNHYSNANSREDAEDTARRMLGADGIYGGSGTSVLSGAGVYGQEMEFYGPAWRPLKGGRSESFTVTRADVGLPPVFLRSAETRCYDTTVMDYFETVHAMKTDGSCQCGDPTRNVRG